MSKFALFSVLLLCSSLTGCLGSDDSFEWPSPAEQDCTIVVEFNLECEIYIPGQESPHYSLSNPENGDLWIIYLSGFIKSWDGTSLSEVVDSSSSSTSSSFFFFLSNIVAPLVVFYVFHHLIPIFKFNMMFKGFGIIRNHYVDHILLNCIYGALVLNSHCLHLVAFDSHHV